MTVNPLPWQPGSVHGMGTGGGGGGGALSFVVKSGKNVV